MNRRQARTLAAIFADPVSPTIEFARIESLLDHLGCEKIEGRGSHVRFHKDGRIISFSRPHPAREAKRYQVKDAREFLTKIGVTP